MVSSTKKKKAERVRARARASEIFGRIQPKQSVPFAQPSPPPTSFPLTMSSARRDSSPVRRAPPKGPRAEGEGLHFTSATWKARERERSRSRSPDRHPLGYYDSYKPRDREVAEYREEVERRSKENYRPRYDDETSTRPLTKDPWRKY
jgi:hypothetical protein